MNCSLSTGRSGRTGSQIRYAALVFGAALAVRLAYAAEAWSSPLFRVPTMDADAYYRLALEFARGGWLQPEGEPYWQPPFYPVVLALWMTVAGDSVLGIKLAQFVLGSINCALVLLIGSRVFGERVGLASGLAAAVCGPMIYFDGELLTPTLQIFLNLFSVTLLIRALDTGKPRLLAAAGVVLGLSIITRPDTIILLFAAVIWAAVRLRASFGLKKAVFAFALMPVCAALPVIPVSVRNYVVGGDRVMVSSNGGINFYIGNNPDEEATRAIRPGPEWDALQALPKKQNPGARPSEQSAWFYRESLRWIAGNPADWLALMFKKAVMYITAVEGRRNNDPYHYRQHSVLYSILMWRWGTFAFPMGIVLPLAVVGLLVRARTPTAGILYAYLAAQFVSVVAFFVCSRYRVPAYPVLLMFAAAGVESLWCAVREQRIREHLIVLILAACVMLVSNLNIYGVDADRRPIDADTHLYTGHILEREGDIAGAVAHYRRAVELNPRHEPSRFCLADLLDRTGKTQEAREQLRAALAVNPTSPASNARLGEILEREGDLAGAVKHYRLAVRADRSFVEKLVAVAERAYAQELFDLAVEALEAVVRAEPGWAEARRSLGTALMRVGALNDAVRQLQEACRLAPDSADCFVALGLAYRMRGEPEKAGAAFSEAIRIGPEKEVRARIENYLRRLPTQEPAGHMQGNQVPPAGVSKP